MTLEDGTVLSPALGTGAFVERTLAASGQCRSLIQISKPTRLLAIPFAFFSLKKKT